MTDAVDQHGASTAVEPLALESGEAAALLGISRSHFWKLHSAGQVPAPVRFGRATRWSRRELELWLQAGAPSRERWEDTKGSCSR
jgi:excisionase family DNA binding protein